MDPLTQGLLGAAAAQVVGRQNALRRSAVAGFLAGMAADLDVLISSEVDHLLKIEFHRHFTHALFFIPFGGLICALALWPFFRKHASFLKLFLWTTLGYATHGLLDACTSYGTSLYLPFSNTRVSWSMMSIVDPIFTPVLLLAVLGAYVTKRQRVIQLGVAFVFAYFAFGVVQRDEALSAQAALMRSRGHVLSAKQQPVVKPTIGNLLLWRSIYQVGDTYFVDAIRVSPFSGDSYYPGTSVKKLDVAKDLSWLTPNTTAANDLARFTHFSQGFVVQRTDDPMQIVDLRYAILPDSLEPLWVIALNPDDTNAHTPFLTFRRNLPEVRKRFWEQVRGIGATPF